MTPYHYWYPIDYIPDPYKENPDLTWRTKVYQSLIGSINWLAVSTHPYVAPIISFLALYQRDPATGH